MPLEADNADINTVLEKRRAGTDVDEDGQCREYFADFQNWLPYLKEQVIILGKLLDADRKFVHFPLVTIVEDLEYIYAAVRLNNHSLPLDWVSTTLRELKIPYGMLVETYFQIWASRREDGFVVEFLAGSISALILNWISDAAR